MTERGPEMSQAIRFAAEIVAPIFIVEAEGQLLFYNKAAEAILGRTFTETGEMGSGAWSRIFIPTDENGSPLLP